MKVTTQAILLALANADRGEISGLPLWGHLYSEESVRAAAAAFSDHCRVERIAEGDETFLSLSIHTDTAPERRAVAGEFLNFLLNHTLQSRWQKAHD